VATGIDRRAVKRMKGAAVDVIQDGSPRYTDLYVFADGSGLYEKHRDDWFTLSKEDVLVLSRQSLHGGWRCPQLKSRTQFAHHSRENKLSSQPSEARFDGSAVKGFPRRPIGLAVVSSSLMVSDPDKLISSRVGLVNGWKVLIIVFNLHAGRQCVSHIPHY